MVRENWFLYIWATDYGVYAIFIEDTDKGIQN